MDFLTYVFFILLLLGPEPSSVKVPQELSPNFVDIQHQHYPQLQHAYQQLQEDYLQLQMTLRYKEQEGEHMLLQKTHQQQQQEFSQLQDNYQWEHHQLQKKLEQVQKELVTKQEECDLLQQKIRTMEESWRVSHKEIIFTKEKLGKGAWGAIKVGIFREQRVAIKEMHELIISETTLELLHREINTMAQLRHPNLLQFIGAVLDDPSGNPMIITEIMDISLRNAYETKQLTPDPTCEPVMLTIMRDVAIGLNYLHCLPDPIIHRDVSSANVLLESKGPHKWKTKISDFGSANKAHRAITCATGSFIYSAPESFKSTKYAQTTKMDIYGYGVLLCEMMTCCFPNPSVFQDMLQQVCSRSALLYYLIRSCIKEDPSSRPIMKEVIEHLDNHINLHLK